MDILDDVGPAQHQQLVTPFLAPEVVRAGLAHLDVGAHGAVVHHHAFAYALKKVSHLSKYLDYRFSAGLVTPRVFDSPQRHGDTEKSLFMFKKAFNPCHPERARDELARGARVEGPCVWPSYKTTSLVEPLAPSFSPP